MTLAAILAGGTGSRMGNENLPKQYLQLGGRPILAHTAERFLTHAQVEHVIVLVPDLWLEYTRNLLDGHLPEGHNIAVIAGGDSRTGTLRRALDYIQAHFGEDEEHILLTHDAVRPFVAHGIISGNIAAARAHGACTTAIPACDTVIRSEGGKFISDTPPRSVMYQVQTPQTFRCHELRSLMDSLLPEEEALLTDACKIYALRGRPVALVPGEARNFKITYPYDLRVAQAMLE